MELLKGKKGNQLFQYAKRAIEDKDCELEFVYGGDFRSKLDRDDFLRILSILKQKYPSVSEENTLDIIIKDIRTTITGIENIKRYCKTDTIEEVPLRNFIKKRRYVDPSFPSVKFFPIIDYDYNYKINLKSEEEMGESSVEIQSLLMGWKSSLKYFRYKKRYSFITDDNLFRIDVTVVKNNDYNPKFKKNNLYKSFLESGILKNKENYELEIEYIGSISNNGIYPIDIFKEKLIKEKDEKDKELSKKSLEMKTDWASKIYGGDNVYSEIEPYEIAPYDEPYGIEVGIDPDKGEFADIIIYPSDKKMVRPKHSFEDIKYEYWEDSDRLELFEAILMNDKKLLYSSNKENINGDYEGSPQRSDYIEYFVSPSFTDEELKENGEFKNYILVPESYIVKIASFKQPISWAPNKKNNRRKEGDDIPVISVDPVDEVTKEWKPEKYDFPPPPLVTYEQLKEAGEFDEDLRIQGKIFDKKEKNKQPSDINLVTTGLIALFKKNIEDILKLKEDEDMVVSNSDKNDKILEYRNLTEQNDSGYLMKKKNELKKMKTKDTRLMKEIERLELKETKFIGPNPVSMSLDNIMLNSKHSITEGYVVTEKADGIRAQLLIGSDKLGYLITPKKEIIGTDIRFEGCQGKWLFDGEYITHNRNRDPIKLFMIFDIYYAGDGFSKYPNHAYTYPWISRKKKDISRFAIIEDFKQNMNMILNTDFRIGFKSYLEGPKILQKSKKDPDKYTNSSGIFRQSKKLWDIETKKSGYEYSIDGLIYMPMFMSVKSLNEGEVLNNFGGGWSINYKWKPPEENTIDFRVRFVTEKDKKGIKRNKIVSSQINGKVRKCKQVYLFVGYDIKQDRDFDYSWKSLTNDKNSEEENKEIYFDPDKTNSHHICNIPLKDNKIFCEKDNSELLNNQIIEMRYCPDNPEDARWTPLRWRNDKTSPQFFITANNIWSTIQNPVTTEMITGLDDPPKLEDKDESEVKKDNYYIDNENESKQDISLRKLHNYIKNKLITSICSIGNKSISIMDTSIGRGGDIQKYLYSKNRIDFLLGLDISGDVPEAAKRFYLETRKKPKAMFIQYDTSESIKDGFGYKGTDEIIERNRNLINIIYNKKKPVPNEYKRIEKDYHKIADKGFDVISSQFTIHYYFKDEMTLRGYLQNVSDNCNKGGYFIGTCYDGKKIFELLGDTDEYEMRDNLDNLVFSIKKDYELDNFDFDKTNIKQMFNQKIKVEMSSIGQPITEYLVNFDLLKEMMKLYKFKLVSPELRGVYNGLFNKEEYSLEPGLGSFGKIIDNLGKLSEKDTLLKPGGPYSKSMAINRKDNEKLKLLSSLNNWFVFQKY